MCLPITDTLSELDCLTLERNSQIKHELIFKESIEMSGASKNHNRIVRNIVGLFYNLLINKEFECSSNDLRVFDPISGSFCYPDIVEVDNDPKFLDCEFDTLLNPIF